MARHCLGNDLQAKAAGYKPVLFQANKNLGVPDDIVLECTLPFARPFRSLTITLFTSLAWTEFSPMRYQVSMLTKKVIRWVT